MNTDGVEVLHVADGDAVVAAITNYFVLDFLSTFHRLFDEDLRRVGKGSGAELAELVNVVGET